MASIQKVEFSNFTWTNFVNPAEKEIRELGEKYKFHPLDLADCLSLSHRSKIDIYPKYTFLVLLFPVYNQKNREIETAEINFFISKIVKGGIFHGARIKSRDLVITHIGNNMRDGRHFLTNYFYTRNIDSILLQPFF